MAVISDVPGASGNHRGRNRFPLGWIERLENKAAIMSGQTSGTIFQAVLDRLISGYGRFLILEDDQIIDEEVVTFNGAIVTHNGEEVTHNA